jgi:hypothetical protein
LGGDGLKLLNHIDDILFALGAILLSAGGFLIYPPAGIIILGICCMAYGLIYAKAAAEEKWKRGVR